jgi:hypothetical protein
LSPGSLLWQEAKTLQRNLGEAADRGGACGWDLLLKAPLVHSGQEFVVCADAD